MNTALQKEASSPQDRSVVANGIPLQYLDWGGPGPALILIHGVTDNPHAFDDLAPAFTDRYRVLAYARRGHGRSAAAAPYNTETYTQDLRCFMDVLSIGKADLVGWSMGGNEITRMAGQHPDRVGRIIYLDGAYDWADPEYRRAYDAMPGVLLGIPPEALSSFEAYCAFQHAQTFTGVDSMDRLGGYFRETVSIQPDGSIAFRMADLYATLVEAMLTDAPREYTSVRCPALALYAQTLFDTNASDPARREAARQWESQYMIPFREKSIARVRRELSQVRIVDIPGTHSDFFITRRAQVVAEMRSFLAGPAGASPGGRPIRETSAT